MPERVFLLMAGLWGAISVAIDAVARHLLAAEPYRMDLAATSARYGLFHAAALLGIALFAARGFWLTAAGWFFVAGLILFCGSLDAIALGASPALATITPWGGTAFILGWLAVAIAAWRGRAPRS